MAQALDRPDVEFGKSPKHFAITCDGHRRFAVEHGLSLSEGYELGVKLLFNMIPWIFIDHGVEVFSVNFMPYSITVDTSPRAQRRAQAVWEPILSYFSSDKVSIFHKYSIRFMILGEKTALPLDILGILEDLENSTMDYSPRKFYLALGYSHIREVLSASKNFSGEMTDTLEFSRNLWVQEPVDLFYRPGGVHVRGDFLLLQSIHARIFFDDKLFPEITKEDIDNIFKGYIEHNDEHARTSQITRSYFS